ncbi:MAG: UDP-N-acetylmuramate--L-alanine ligase [Candidatus Margulisiibacteriota bacterium]|nr:MAG: UDP-N-acetylmuramate--L-alanine ligase [Candidatus Margulisbacteria bacterium GWD2_39_127]OGI02962.1 MAG: UDP-N-acetylmuramate--L-alanine ligase [Candidatus Margulisbacteria bacterium GWF2_38_17]OGI09445.1 MAG: UDP-N-acetylmuramate--L-alanine ligase [Candidatus Margulisbacteria bacterium GWE2_39_32]PZM78755.1 MAG: UDP-N-acetylmuramate--L-alanine ligase [Candidatus Margulisiibacteriota bacterium]HAR63343.1 UDP-N-acetylmuramate--L-alanine ligase [Candidatus Margulisiibacteriota bacterium]
MQKRHKDINEVKNIHFIGIGGEGMSPIAKILLEKKFNVSGSDMRENLHTFRLKDKGAQIYFKHDETNIRSADVVVISTAIPEDNPELQAARAHKIPVLKRAQMLSWLMEQEEKKIAVAGTHGKTTTTSMISQIFSNCNLSPTFIIGGEINGINANCALGEGKYFIAEADESDGSFLELNPNIMVITNIEPEHLDYYRDLDHIFETFKQFVSKLPPDGYLVINYDHPNNKQFIESIDCNILTYGFDNFSDIRAENIEFFENNTSFDVIYKHKYLTRIELQIPGKHNVQNALAALLIGLEHGLPIEPMRQALYSFLGTKKRFQKIGEFNDITFIDDYAHHPTEIAATLSAARAGWPDRRIIVIFQPHRYTRTKLLAHEFSECFNNADTVIITNIYAASEKPIHGISGKIIYDLLEKNQHNDIHYISKKNEIPEFLLSFVKPNDMIITMGAGDIHNVSKETLTRLKQLELIEEEETDN